MRTIAITFMILAVPFLGTYYYRFFKTIASMNEEQRKVYTEAESKWSVLLAIPLVLALLIFDDFIFCLITSLVCAIFLGVGSYWHQNNLKTLDFDSVLLRRFTSLNWLAGLGIGFALISFTLFAYPS